MTASPVKPKEAWCAVGPDGEIDIDMLRRGQAGCEHAASSIRGQAWPRLVHLGWRVLRVRIVRADAPEVAEPAPAPAPARRKAPASPGYTGPERMSAQEYRTLQAGIVRMGVIRR